MGAKRKAARKSEPTTPVVDETINLETVNEVENENDTDNGSFHSTETTITTECEAEKVPTEEEAEDIRTFIESAIKFYTIVLIRIEKRKISIGYNDRCHEAMSLPQNLKIKLPKYLYPSYFNREAIRKLEILEDEIFNEALMRIAQIRNEVLQEDLKHNIDKAHEIRQRGYITHHITRQSEVLAQYKNILDMKDNYFHEQIKGIKIDKNFLSENVPHSDISSATDTPTRHNENQNSPDQTNISSCASKNATSLMSDSFLLDVNKESYDQKHVSILTEENKNKNNLKSYNNNNIDLNHTNKDENNINYKLNKLTKAVEAVAKVQIEQLTNFSEILKKPVLNTSNQVPATTTDTIPNIAPSLHTLPISHNNHAQHFHKQQSTFTSQSKRPKLNYSNTYTPTFNPENQPNPYNYHKKPYNHNPNFNTIQTTHNNTTFSSTNFRNDNSLNNYQQIPLGINNNNKQLTSHNQNNYNYNQKNNNTHFHTSQQMHNQTTNQPNIFQNNNPSDTYQQIPLGINNNLQTIPPNLHNVDNNHDYNNTHSITHQQSYNQTTNPQSNYQINTPYNTYRQIPLGIINNTQLIPPNQHNDNNNHNYNNTHFTTLQQSHNQTTNQPNNFQNTTLSNTYIQIPLGNTNNAQLLPPNQHNDNNNHNYNNTHSTTLQNTHNQTSNQPNNFQNNTPYNTYRQIPLGNTNNTQLISLNQHNNISNQNNDNHY